MEYIYRFFVNGTPSALASYTYDSKTGYPPIPRKGEYVVIEEEAYLESAYDWDAGSLDYDNYMVESVEYSYSSNMVLVDIMVVGKYLDCVD